MEGSQVSPTGSGANSLGKYRLIAELGHGGMAEVYLAVVRGPAGFNKLVVIKQIRPQLAEDPEFLGMFLDEARLAARLSHPNVVQTNEVGQEGERYFIAMEYLEGQPLNRVTHRLQKAGGLSLPMNLRIVADALAGLHHAHELTDYDGTPLKVVHRDVTPHNVFVTYDGQVKVVDFGIAKALNSSSETRTGVLKGKVAYMAPEQARGERVDRRADIFSVGVMMWEAATGKRLWKGVPDITILQRLLSGEIPTPRSIKPELPEKLEAIILKALSHQREDRYETAADLQNAIDAYLEECGERVSARDVGKLIATHFEADRQKIKGIIEEQLRAKTVEAFSLPVIDQHTHSGSGSGNATRADRSSHSSVSDAIKAEAAGQSSGSTSYTGPNVLFASSATTSGEASRGRRGLVAGGALAVGALLAVVFWQMTKSPPPAPPPPVTGSTHEPATPTPPPAPTDVEVNIAAYPQEAKLYLDDRLLVSNPFKAKLQKDPALHHLRIEAPGFVSQAKDITLDKDSMLEVSLLKDPNAAAVDKQVKQGVVPVAPVDPMAPPTKKPIHQVDTSNPYGH